MTNKNDNQIKMGFAEIIVNEYFLTFTSGNYELIENTLNCKV